MRPSVQGKVVVAYEHDVLVCDSTPPTTFAGSRNRAGTDARGAARLRNNVHVVPEQIYKWLVNEALRAEDERGERRDTGLKLVSHEGQPAVKLTSMVGVLRAEDGFTIEILPKVGRRAVDTRAAVEGATTTDTEETLAMFARQVLWRMLQCLGPFAHARSTSAQLALARMPMWEMFVAELLASVERVVQRGLRRQYNGLEDNLSVLRGRLLVAEHLRHNLVRRDRFYTAFDEFTLNRAENRVLHAALQMVLRTSADSENVRTSRRLCALFHDIPVSRNVEADLAAHTRERGSHVYDEPLAWARLLLTGLSPLTSAGHQMAPSLLFPMEKVFEAYVSKHLPTQLKAGYRLHAQVQAHHLITHEGYKWFAMRPDLLVKQEHANRMVLDAKWKLLDGSPAGRVNRYGISQADLYQMQAYAMAYLPNGGDLALIYPRTPDFPAALPVFEFNTPSRHRLWVLPFDVEQTELLLPSGGELAGVFGRCGESAGRGGAAVVVADVGVADGVEVVGGFEGWR